MTWPPSIEPDRATSAIAADVPSGNEPANRSGPDETAGTS